MKTPDEYLAQRKALHKPPYDLISIAALNSIHRAGASATYADIGRAVNQIKGRKTTNHRSNMFWGVKTTPYLASFGLIEMFVGKTRGAGNRYPDLWRLTPKGAALIADVDPETHVG